MPADIGWVIGRYDAGGGGWHAPAAQLWTTPARPLLLICAEWLDDLPCPVVSRQDGRWRQVLVDDDGREECGPPVDPADGEWLRRWWPASDRLPAGRAEVGRTRDRAWTALVAALTPHGGAALMIDYGHLRAQRPREGTLTGFRAGRQLRPAPVASMNLTAHVAVDAIAEAGARAGARTEFLLDQRTALSRSVPCRSTREAAGALRGLQDRSERGALTTAFGHHWWLLQSVPAQSC